jgi:hypothetical protein
MLKLTVLTVRRSDNAERLFDGRARTRRVRPSNTDARGGPTPSNPLAQSCT